MTNEWLLKLWGFIVGHFDTIVTVGITIIGFVVTYLGTRKNFKDEVIKNKLQVNADSMKELPYQIIQMMNRANTQKPAPAVLEKELSEVLSKILAYGSKNAIAIAARMQQQLYKAAHEAEIQRQWEVLVLYSLLITQIKYDLSSEIISPESWFELKMTDYKNYRAEIKKDINLIINELQLNKKFIVKEVNT